MKEPEKELEQEAKAKNMRKKLVQEAGAGALKGL